jgi:hypothetical protein
VDALPVGCNLILSKLQEVQQVNPPREREKERYRE